MDNEASNHVTAPGISIRNGPVEEMDVDDADQAPRTNGIVAAKRKARSSVINGKSYKDDTSSDSDDNEPLVCRTTYKSIVHCH
jgi:DNA topoisomerase-1